MLSCALLFYAHIHHLAYLLSVSCFVARDALSIKYRGSVDPNMCVVQSKALLLSAHI